MQGLELRGPGENCIGCTSKNAVEASAELDLTTGPFWQTPLGEQVRDFAISLSGEVFPVTTGWVVELLKLRRTIDPTAIPSGFARTGMFTAFRPENFQGKRRYFDLGNLLVTGLALLHLERGYSLNETAERLIEMLKGTSLRPLVSSDVKQNPVFRGVTTRRFFSDRSPWRRFSLEETHLRFSAETQRPDFVDSAAVAETYDQIVDPVLRGYLEQFEERVIKRQKTRLLRCGSVSDIDTCQQLGLQVMVVDLLQRRVRHLGIIEPVITNEGNSFSYYDRSNSLSYYDIRPKPSICFDRDGLRAFAAICWKIEECIKDGRDMGGWENLVSETREALGSHYLAGKINQPKGLTDSADRELRYKILKIERVVAVGQGAKTNNTPGVAGDKAPSPRTMPIPRGYTPDAVEAQMDNLDKVKANLLTAAVSLEANEKLYRKGAFSEWTEQRLDKLKERIPMNFDELSPSVVADDPETANLIIRLIMFAHIATSIYGRGEAEDLESAFKEVRNRDLNMGIKDVLHIMRDLKDEYKNLGSVSRLMVQRVKQLSGKK